MHIFFFVILSFCYLRILRIFFTFSQPKLLINYKSKLIKFECLVTSADVVIWVQLFTTFGFYICLDWIWLIIFRVQEYFMTTSKIYFKSKFIWIRLILIWVRVPYFMPVFFGLHIGFMHMRRINTD